MGRDSRKEALDQIGRSFQVSVARVHAANHPGDVDAQRMLAYALTLAGRHEEALEVDRRLVEAEPARADFRYDLACSLALSGRAEEAFRELEESLRLGFADRDHLMADQDLVSLHGDPRWPDLVARVPRAPQSSEEKE